MSDPTNYDRIIIRIFESKFKDGDEEVPFTREDISNAAKYLKVSTPKNLGDVPYTFRYRRPLPKEIIGKAPNGMAWHILGIGVAKYCFVARKPLDLVPKEYLPAIEIPDATPDLIKQYALKDEQALLARLRYARLIDLFLGLVCYPLQSHLRTTVKEIGQIETDDLYVGIDCKGTHYIIPVQAKGLRDHLSEIQIEQDVAMCQDKFPGLTCLPVAAKLHEKEVISLFSFSYEDNRLSILSQENYLLVSSEEIGLDLDYS